MTDGVSIADVEVRLTTVVGASAEIDELDTTLEAEGKIDSTDDVDAIIVVDGVLETSDGIAMDRVGIPEVRGRALAGNVVSYALRKDDCQLRNSSSTITPNSRSGLCGTASSSC